MKTNKTSVVIASGLNGRCSVTSEQIKKPEIVYTNKQKRAVRDLSCKRCSLKDWRFDV